MLCVLPKYRGQGIGTELLFVSEEYIRSQGYTEVQFCDGVDYITPGIPMYEGNVEFFEKHGYQHSWGTTECVDMNLSLSDFDPGEYRIGDTIRNIQYRWAVPEDLDRIIDCVDDAWSEFTQYYRNETLYDGKHSQSVLIALCDNIVCGTLIVSNQTEAKGLGSVGCTTTRHDYQRRGIATTMVKLGTRYLYEIGLPTAYLGYTYTEIIPMYARSGYQVCMKYFMGKKQLL